MGKVSRTFGGELKPRARVTLPPSPIRGPSPNPTFVLAKGPPDLAGSWAQRLGEGKRRGPPGWPPESLRLLPTLSTRLPALPSLPTPAPPHPGLQRGRL